MASRIDFACHAIPVAAVAAGENLATETIARDPSKIFTGAGTVAVAYTNTLGYTTGTATYLTVTDAAWTDVVCNAKVFIFIRNTGYTSSAFTTKSTQTLRVQVTVTTETVECLLIPAGAAVALPVCSDALTWGLRSTSGNLCVEYFVTD